MSYDLDPQILVAKDQADSLPDYLVDLTRIPENSFQPERARALLADFIAEETLDNMTEAELRVALDYWPQLVWQSGIDVANLEMYLLLSCAKTSGADDRAPVARSRRVQLDRFLADTTNEIKKTFPVDELLERVQTTIALSTELGGVATNGVNRTYDGGDSQGNQADQDEQLSEDDQSEEAVFDRQIAVKFLKKAYPGQQPDLLSQQELDHIVEQMLQLMTNSPRHFMISAKPVDTPAYAERLRLKLQGKTAAQISQELQISESTVGNSYLAAIRLTGQFLPWKALIGEEKLKPRNVGLIDGLNSPYPSNAASTALNRQVSMRELSLRYTDPPQPYEGLFESDEMRLLALVSFGVRAQDLDKIMKNPSGSASRLRTILLAKFDLPPSTQSYGALIYEAVVGRIILPDHKFEPPAIPLSSQEKRALILGAKGFSTSAISSDIGTSSPTARHLRTSARQKLKQPGGEYSEAVLAAGYGLIDYYTAAEKEQLAKTIRQVNAERGEEFERNRPLTIAALTDGIPEKKWIGDRWWTITRLKTVSQYLDERRRVSREEGLGIAALLGDDSSERLPDEFGQERMPDDFERESFE